MKKATYQKPATKLAIAELESLLDQGSIIAGEGGGPNVAEGKEFLDDDESVIVHKSVWDD